jgi:hypothetical protein
MVLGAVRDAQMDLLKGVDVSQNMIEFMASNLADHVEAYRLTRHNGTRPIGEVRGHDFRARFVSVISDEPLQTAQPLTPEFTPNGIKMGRVAVRIEFHFSLFHADFEEEFGEGGSTEW